MNEPLRLHKLCLSSIDRGSGVPLACDLCWSVVLERRRPRHSPWGVMA